MAVKERRKLEQIVTMKNGRPAATTIQLPESVKNWVGNPLPAQALDTYEEITQGKPHGEIQNGK